MNEQFVEAVQLIWSSHVALSNQAGLLITCDFALLRQACDVALSKKADLLGIPLSNQADLFTGVVVYLHGICQPEVALSLLVPDA